MRKKFLEVTRMRTLPVSSEAPWYRGQDTEKKFF